MALRNVVFLGVIFFIASDSFTDINLKDEKDVVCSPQETQHTTCYDDDPLPEEVERSPTGCVNNLGYVIESVI